MQQQQQQTLGQLVDIPIHARYCSPVEEPVGSCIRDVDVQIELYLIGEEKGEIQGQNLTMSMRWKIPSVCIRFKQVETCLSTGKLKLLFYSIYRWWCLLFLRLVRAMNVV